MSEESDEDVLVVPKVQENEALLALSTLRLYEEKQEEGENRFIQGLKRHERHLIWLLEGKKKKKKKKK